MSTHPYLRAYLAGVFIPTFILPVILAAFIVVRLVLQIPVPIERGIVFPMALVPLLWGLWNALWLGSHERTRLPVGLHGAILPALLAPGGAIAGRCLGIVTFGADRVTWFHAISVPYAVIAVGFCFGVAVYYLVWKYIVGSINRVLDIAS